MPLGEYTVTLRVTGSFRDSRDAAVKIKSIVSEAVDREAERDRHYQQNHSSQSGSLGWSVSAPQIRRVEIL